MRISFSISVAQLFAFAGLNSGHIHASRPGFVDFFVPLFVPLLSQLKQKESRKNQPQVEQLAKTKGANQLNIPVNPLIFMVLQAGFEPAAPGLGIHCYNFVSILMNYINIILMHIFISFDMGQFWDESLFS